MLPDCPADARRAERRLARFHRFAEPPEQVAHRGAGDPPADQQVEDAPEGAERRPVRAFQGQARRLDRVDPQPQRAVEVREEARPGRPVDLQRVVSPARLVLVDLPLRHQPHAPPQMPAARRRQVAQGDVQLDAALGGMREKILGIVVRDGERTADDALDHDAGDTHDGARVPGSAQAPTSAPVRR